MDSYRYISDELDRELSPAFKVYKAEDTKQYLSDCKPNSLTILMQNIRSIPRNYDLLMLFMSRLPFLPDILVLTECRLNEYSTPIHINGYKYSSSKIYLNQNDGIVIYSKDTLRVTFEEPHCNDANCYVTCIDNLITLITIYRSPSKYNVNNFRCSLDQILKQYQNKHVILLGDMNIDIKISNTDDRSDKYLNLITMHGFYPAHSLPTREHKCLDHVFVKSEAKCVSVVCRADITDHDAIICNLDINTPPDNTSQIKRNLIDKIDFDGLQQSLETEDWKTVYEQNVVECATSTFINKLSGLIDKHKTQKRIPHKKQIRQPWITTGLLNCIRKRDRLHLYCRQNPNDIDLRNSYKKYRNICNSLLKRLKTDYERQKVLNCAGDKKKQWRAVKEICHMVTDKQSNTDLLKLGDTPTRALDNVNHYFTKVGENLAKEILSKSNETEDNLCNKYRDNAPLHSFFLSPTNDIEIIKFIDKLKSKTAPGIDGITTETVKKLKLLIVKPLVYIINLSMETGTVPSKLKIASVCPIHKAGQTEVVSNYRPISLLSIFAKLLEKVINARLVQYLENNVLLSNNQYGFRANRGTTEAISLLTNTIAKHLDSGQKCLGVFLDLAKAFDTVSVPLLLKKLEMMGIRGMPLQWFTSYLSDRKQYVKLGDLHRSGLSNVSFGVPQGSVIGPTLFLIYINDICNIPIQDATTVAFADDTAIIFSGSSWLELKHKTEEGMKLVDNWLANNLLTLNVTKTKFIPFSIINVNRPNFDKIDIHSCPDPPNSINKAPCNCVPIDRVANIKYLGIYLDEYLNWSAQIEHLSARTRRLIFTFKKLRDVVDNDLLKVIYFALGQSILTYGIEAWGGAAKTYLIKLERAQRALLKVMFRKPFLFPTTSLYNEARVLNVRQLYIKAILLVFHRSSLITRSQTSRRIYIWHTEGGNTVFYQRFSQFLAPFLYNKANRELDLKNKSRYVCKRSLSEWLMTLSYDETENLLSIE